MRDFSSTNEANVKVANNPAVQKKVAKGLQELLPAGGQPGPEEGPQGRGLQRQLRQARGPCHQSQ